MHTRWRVLLCCGAMCAAWNWSVCDEAGKAAAADKDKPAAEAAKDEAAVPAEKEADAAAKKPVPAAKGAVKAAPAEAVAEAKPERRREEFALDLDAEKKALAEQVCPKLLKMRDEFDYLMAQYVESRRTLGFALRKRAEKIEPKLRAEIEKLRLGLAKEAERGAMPFERERKTMKQKEAVLIERIAKATERNQNVEKLMGEMKKVQEALAVTEKAADLIQDIGKPRLNMQRWQYVVLYERINPGIVEESYLLNIIRKFPELTQARLDIDNYAAEIAALKDKGEGGTAVAAKIEKYEKGLEETAARLKTVYEATVATIKSSIETAKAEIAKLEPKTEQMRGKPQGNKAEQEIARLNTSVEGWEASLGMLRRFISPDGKDPERKKAAAAAKLKKAADAEAKGAKAEQADPAGKAAGKAEKPDAEKDDKKDEAAAQAGGEAKPKKAAAKDADAAPADAEEAAEQKPKAKKKGAAKAAEEK